MTNVDACEDFQEACDDLNVCAVQYLADVCAEVGAHLVHILPILFLMERMVHTQKRTRQIH